MRDERGDTESWADEVGGGARSDAKGDDGLVRPHVARKHPDRARQFLPFAALKGYYDLVRTRERVAHARHEATDEDVARLSAVLARVAKGDTVRAVHYVEHEAAYVETTGVVRAVDTAFQTLAIGSTDIAFSDLSDLAILPTTDGTLRAND